MSNTKRRTLLVLLTIMLVVGLSLLITWTLSIIGLAGTLSGFVIAAVAGGGTGILATAIVLALWD